MLPPLAAPRHPRFTSQQILWALAALAGLLLLLSPETEGRTAAAFTLGTWVLAAWWFFAASPLLCDRPFPLGPALLAWAGVQALATVAGHDPSSSLNAFATELACLLAFAVAWASARNLRGVERAVAGLALLAGVLAVYGVYQHVFGLADTYQRVFAGHGPQGSFEAEIAQRLASQRAFSLFAYPNTFAGFLDLFAPVSLVLALTARRAGWRWLWSAVAAVILAGVYASGSVLGGVLAVTGAAAVLVLWAYGRGRRPAPELLGLGAVAFAACLWLLVRGRSGSEWLTEAHGRLMTWASAWQMFLGHPWTGVGPGLFGTFFPDYQDPNGFYVRFAHNYLLQRLAETGLAGGVVLLWFVVDYGRALLKGWTARLSERRRVLAAGLGVGVILAGVHALLDVDLHFLKNAAVWWVCAGALLGLVTPRVAPAARAARPAPGPAVLQTWTALRYGLLAVLTLLLWRGGKSLLGELVLYAGGGAVLAWFFLMRLSGAARGRVWVRDTPLHEPLGLLFVWGTIAAMVSAHPAGAIPGLSLAAVGLLLYMVAVHLSDLRRWLWIWLPAAAAGLAVFAGWQAFAHPGLRASAGWPNPNLLAAFLALGLSVWMGWFTSRPRNLAITVLGSLGTLAGFLGLLATGSFGGLLNLAAGLTLLAFWWKKLDPSRMRPLGVQALLLIAVLVCVPLGSRQRLLHLANYQPQVHERMGMARAALDMALDRPLTGYGPGNFGAAFERYSFPNPGSIARYGRQTDFAHSEPLQLLAVLGVPGLALLLWLLWACAAAFRKQWTGVTEAGPADPVDASIRGALWAGLAGAAVQGLFDFNWHLPALWVWGVVLLGAVLAPAPSRAPAPEPKRANLTEAPAVILCLLAVAAVTAAWRPLWSRHLLELGEAQLYKKNFKVAAQEFQRALKVHPLSAAAYDRLGQTQSDFYAALGSDNGYQMAEWALAKALTLDQLDPFIHRHLGQLYGLRAVQASGAERQEFLHRAIGEYRLATGQAPHQAFLKFELGNLDRAAGYLDDAERSWRDALALEPNYAAAWSNLGVALEIRGHWSDAEGAYRHALALRQLQPDDNNKFELDLLALNWAVVHFNLAHLLERQGRWGEAGLEYRQVLLLEPENAQAKQRWEMLRVLAR